MIMYTGLATLHFTAIANLANELLANACTGYHDKIPQFLAGCTNYDQIWVLPRGLIVSQCYVYGGKMSD